MRHSSEGEREGEGGEIKGILTERMVRDGGVNMYDIFGKSQVDFRGLTEYRGWGGT